MINQAKLAKQMIDLQRATFDGMLNNALAFWDQAEKVAGVMMDQAVWVPEEGRRAFREWMGTNKRGCENFKNAIDDGFNRMQSCFMGEDRSQGAPT